MLPGAVDVALGRARVAVLLVHTAERCRTCVEVAGEESRVMERERSHGEDCEGRRMRTRCWRTYGDAPPRLALLRTGPTKPVVSMFMRSRREAMAARVAGRETTSESESWQDCPRQRRRSGKDQKTVFSRSTFSVYFHVDFTATMIRSRPRNASEHCTLRVSGYPISKLY